jgi:hypothetical protein
LGRALWRIATQTMASQGWRETSWRAGFKEGRCVCRRMEPDAEATGQRWRRRRSLRLERRDLIGLSRYTCICSFYHIVDTMCCSIIVVTILWQSGAIHHHRQTQVLSACIAFELAKQSRFPRILTSSTPTTGLSLYVSVCFYEIVIPIDAISQYDATMSS